MRGLPHRTGKFTPNVVKERKKEGPPGGLLLFRPVAERGPGLRRPDRFLRPPAHKGGTLPIKPDDLLAVRLQRTGEDSEIVGSGLRVENVESVSLGGEVFDVVKSVFCISEKFGK